MAVLPEDVRGKLFPHLYTKVVSIFNGGFQANRFIKVIKLNKKFV